MNKKIPEFLFIILAVVGICRFCHRETDGFRISKIRNNTFEIEESPLQYELSQKELFAQPFTYLARGKESFVFLSHDKKVVLKLLNNHYNRRLRVLQFFPWQKEKRAYLHKKKQSVYQSYLLSFAQLKKETGLLYLHLHKTNHLQQKARIIDKLGIEHEVDLDQTGFILQKKAELAYPQLKFWIEKGDTLSAQQGICSLLSLLKKRFQKGLNDKDPLIRTNIGFIDGEAYFLDFGPFSKNPFAKTPEERKEEIEKITHSLKLWLSKEDPSLAAFLDQELSNFF
jgi:hypothetical protein